MHSMDFTLSSLFVVTSWSAEILSIRIFRWARVNEALSCRVFWITTEVSVAVGTTRFALDPAPELTMVLTRNESLSCSLAPPEVFFPPTIVHLVLHVVSRRYLKRFVYVSALPLTNSRLCCFIFHEIFLYFILLCHNFLFACEFSPTIVSIFPCHLWHWRIFRIQSCFLQHFTFHFLFFTFTVKIQIYHRLIMNWVLKSLLFVYLWFSLFPSFVFVLLFKTAHSADDITSFDQFCEPQSIFSISARNSVRKKNL